MGKTSYKNTTELIKDLTDRVDDLNNGKLGLSDLDELVQSGRELYEHLVVLRHVAFEKAQTEPNEEHPQTTEKEAIAEAASETSVAFDLPESQDSKGDEEDTSQTDLHFDFTAMDDEVEKTIPEEKEEQPEESTAEAVQESTTEATEESAPNSQKEDVQGPPPFETNTKTEDEDDNASLNDAFKKEDDLSLRKKLQKTPVADIRTHISIAKKFEYISSLFDGDAGAYDEAIDFLNTCASGEDARLKLNEYTSRYSWDLEDKSIIKFIELVERRYISG